MHDLPLLKLMAAAFTAAWVLGLIANRLRLSPIVGYLLAGIVIGPYTPGFVGDPHLAPQLAEIGVILLMFGVGLHFNLKELLAVRNLAVPGAIGQSAVATLLGLAVAAAVGWSVLSGVVFGIALAVASTVVLLRVLTDHRLLDTAAGHAAVGWLIVEDVMTVVVLVLIPALGSGPGAGAAHAPLWQTLLISLAKLAGLVMLLLLAGSRVVPWIMVRVARLRSRELFTLTVMVMALAIAVGAGTLFGASMALGAFLAGMVVGQSPVSQQAAIDALPMQDAFAVLFFASVGMLFDPHLLVRAPGLIAACLAIVVIGKPLAAFAIVSLLGHPPRTALVVGLGMAQIGEFSFILAELGHRSHLLDDKAQPVLVACAIFSITLNPLLFNQIERIEGWMQRRPRFWRWINRRALRRESAMNAGVAESLAAREGCLAVVVGYGPVGQAADDILRDRGIETVVIDLNPDTVHRLKQQQRIAIYGDASNIELLAGPLPRATHLIVTLPHLQNRALLIAAAKRINPNLKIFVRARYAAERDELIQAGADEICSEETEAAIALAALVMTDLSLPPATAAARVAALRQTLIPARV